jgi:hypothetical protein
LKAALARLLLLLPPPLPVATRGGGGGGANCLILPTLHTHTHTIGATTAAAAALPSHAIVLDRIARLTTTNIKEILLISFKIPCATPPCAEMADNRRKCLQFFLYLKDCLDHLESLGPCQMNLTRENLPQKEREVIKCEEE